MSSIHIIPYDAFDDLGEYKDFAKVGAAINHLRTAGYPTPPFHLTATTTGASETVSITRLTTSIDTTIDWGDGSELETLVADDTTARTHVYATAGTYTITVDHAHLITRLKVNNAKLGGLNTAELKYSPITYFWATLATECVINSSDMVWWRPTHWYLYSMPTSGTYDIDSADMISWRPSQWQLYEMLSGSYNINSVHMVNWRPAYWNLSSMVSTGTYVISSAHMIDWTPTYWRLYSMSSGTIDIDLDDMAGWVATTTFEVTNIDVIGSLSQVLAATMCRAANSGILASSISHLTALSELNVNDNSYTEADVDTILLSASDAVYANAAHFSNAAPKLYINGTSVTANAIPSGSIGADTTDPLVTPGSGNSNSDWEWITGDSKHKAISGLAAIYVLQNNAGHAWVINYSPFV